MFWRWAGVSLMLVAATAASCPPLSDLEEAVSASTIAATAKTHGNRSLFSIFAPIQFGGIQISAVPPPAAQGQVERRGVGVARGLCLHEIDLCLLVGLLRSQQRKRIDVAVLQLSLRQLKTHFCGIA